MKEHGHLLRRGAAARPPRLARAALALFLAALLAALAPACGAGHEQRLSLLLITMDTTRRDALSCFGGRPGVTPELDRLAEQSLCYDWARTVAPLTLPAHASMLTGLYPPRHTLRVNSLGALPESAETLAERARAQGYETAAFTAAVVLDRAFGLAQGFERYDQPVAPKVQQTLAYESRNAAEVASACLGWLGTRDPARPFFAWVHFFDPHMPYAPPAERARQAGGDLYLGEVAAMDHEIGRILRALDERGLRSNTLVLATADHGESRGAHGEDTHGALCYDATLRVPLLVCYPDGWRAGERSDELVSVADVYPTALEALDLAPTGALDGQSLYRREAGERGVYFESCYGYAGFGWSQILGWADARGKYLHSSVPELYEPGADPEEQRDLAAGLAPTAPELAPYGAALAELLSAGSLAPRLAQDVDASVLDRLEALGYAGAGVVPELPADPLETGGRIAPRAAMENYGRFLSAQTLSAAGQFAAAAGLLERILAAEPENPNALFQYGAVLLQLGRHADALAPLQAALRHGRDWYGPHKNLGLAYAALDRPEEALRHLELALAFEPDLQEPRAPLLQLLDAAGRAADAARYRAQFAGQPR